MADSREPRAKRQKADRLGRSAALERLKNLKGSKNKYDISQVENVYEVVDEKEYTKHVVSRQDDDWIVDDDGSGYVDDGREIFDDDLDSESTADASTSKKKDRKRKKALCDAASSTKANLQYMISNMQTRKKKEEVNLEEDDVLAELLSEIGDDNNPTAGTSKTSKPYPSKMLEKAAEKDYMKRFAAAPKPKAENNPKPTSVLKEINVENVNNKSLELDENESLNVIEETQSESRIVCEEASQEKFGNVKVPDDVIPDCLNIEDFSGDEMYDSFDISGIEDLNSQVTKPTVVRVDVKEEITEEQLTRGWDTMQCKVESVGTENVINTDSIPLQVNNEGKKVVRFFWFDAFETPTQPGTVYLVGKIHVEANTYASFCLVVKDVLRQIYLLPRLYHENDKSKPVTVVDVYNEVNKITSETFCVKAFDFKSRKITKHYVFDPDVPKESDYLEVRYSSKYGPLSADLTGNTFCKVFGTRSSFLEIFLIERKLKGPCWLDLKQFEPATNPVSWCKFEVTCTDVTDIQLTQSVKNIPPPPLIIAGINMRTVVNTKVLQPEIVMLTCLTHHKYSLDKQPPNPPFQQHFCCVTKSSNQHLPMDLYENLQNTKTMNVQKCENERAMLNYFITQFAKIDPDLIVSHDIQNYHKNVLYDRIAATGASNWSKLGRLRRGNINQYNKTQTARDIFLGRLVCDLKLSAQELTKSRSYDLDTLCQIILKLPEGQRMEVEVEDVPKMFHTSQSIIKLISWTLEDTAYIMKMMNDLNILPIALQITNIAGNILSRTLLGGRSERNEYLLMHAFNEKEYIVPEKRLKNKYVDGSIIVDKRSTAQKKKPSFAGGLVLEPKIGFYDKLILLMDFNSLYPSIIQEYNICFTTISSQATEDNLILPNRDLPMGILPTEIRKLVESRKAVKSLMKAPDLSKDQYMQYNIRQLALKLTANSMYGCLGFSNSRFYAKNLAALITLKGREILTNTRDLVQKMSYEVIYGDTDSIMVNTNTDKFDDTLVIGKKIKQEINKLYRQVELDIDGVFKYLLLLKKKKYAAVTVTKTKSGELKFEKEYKGLDIVRRDWCSLATEAGKVILDHIFTDQSEDERIDYIHTHLSNIKEDLEGGKVPISMLVINKQLTKEPKTYVDKNSLSHVQVALRYNAKGGKPLGRGDTVQYVICEDGTDKSHTQRAYHVEEFKNSTTLKIDTKYYLAQQIHPVIDRICAPIDGTDAYALANALGIDSSSFKKSSAVAENVEKIGENVRKTQFVFKNVSSFEFDCISCKTPNNIRSALYADNIPFLARCANGSCSARPIDYLPGLINQLALSMRSCINKYYLNELICEDPACPGETRKLPVRFEGRYPVCMTCKKGVLNKTYTDYELYTQLNFFLQLFDLNKLEKKPLMEADILSGFHTLKESVERCLKCSAYSVINLNDLFSKVHYRGKSNILSVMGIESVYHQI